MKRSSFIRYSGISLASLALFGYRGIAASSTDPAYQIRMLSDDMGIFTEKGGTILFFLNKEGIILVDSQFPDTAQHLVDELAKKTENAYRLLINTHHHRDHTAGNLIFKNKVTHLLAHANSKANQVTVAIQQKTEDQQFYPDQTFTDTWREKIGNETVSLKYFGAAHTNGDSIVHFEKAGIVHLGDLVFNKRHPFVDRAAGASMQNWITVLEKTAGEFSRKTKYVCGHAASGYDVVIKKEDLLAFRDYLGNVLTFTEAAIKAGKSKEEIIKALAIPGSPEWQGDGIERPLAAAYDELNSK
jgi:glyoxylase-like metal-dependent hydrolase (beta-lactamase superfamily II)